MSKCTEPNLWAKHSAKWADASKEMPLQSGCRNFCAAFAHHFPEKRELWPAQVLTASPALRPAKHRVCPPGDLQGITFSTNARALSAIPLVFPNVGI